MGLRDRFQYIPGQARKRPIRNGTIVLALFGALLYFAYTSGSVPFLPKGGEVITADFKTIANVSPGKTPVRVKGVDVGEVEKVERLEGGRGVRVTMRIEDGKGVDLRRDAQAHIYWRTLLGFSFYIQLDQGGDAQKLGTQTIAMKDTTTQVELDQVVQSLTPPSRAGMQTILKEFDKGFGDEPAGRTLDATGPAMKQIAPGLDSLRGTRPGDLTDTIRNASKLMGALAKNEVQLGQVVANGNQTLGVTAAKRAAIASTLQNGASTLDQTKTTMVKIRGTLDELDPRAQELRPGARELDDASKSLRPALADLRPVLDDARPALVDLRPALKRLRSASRAGVPFMKNIDPSLTRLRETILPGLDKKGPVAGRKVYEEIGPVAATVASSASMFDANGHTQRFQAVNGGPASVAALPCSADLFKGEVKCSDLQQVLAGFLGGPGAANPPGKMVDSQAATRSSSSSSSGASSAPASRPSAVKGLGDQTMSRVQSLLKGGL